MPQRDSEGRTPGQRAYETFYAFYQHDAPRLEVEPYDAISDKQREAWEEAAFSVVHPSFERSRHRMAQTIKIVRIGFGSPANMYIDGVLFPYFTQDGYSIHPARNNLPSVHFTVVAERVEVLDASGLGNPRPDKPRKREADGEQDANHPVDAGQARGDVDREQEGQVGGDPGGPAAV